jgi:ribosome biogenesis protein Tsr3
VAEKQNDRLGIGRVNGGWRDCGEQAQKLQRLAEMLCPWMCSTNSRRYGRLVTTA